MIRCFLFILTVTLTTLTARSEVVKTAISCLDAPDFIPYNFDKIQLQDYEQYITKTVFDYFSTDTNDLELMVFVTLSPEQPALFQFLTRPQKQQENLVALTRELEKITPPQTHFIPMTFAYRFCVNEEPIRHPKITESQIKQRRVFAIPESPSLLTSHLQLEQKYRKNILPLLLAVYDDHYDSTVLSTPIRTALTEEKNALSVSELTTKNQDYWDQLATNQGKFSFLLPVLRIYLHASNGSYGYAYHLSTLTRGLMTADDPLRSLLDQFGEEIWIIQWRKKEYEKKIRLAFENNQSTYAQQLLDTLHLIGTDTRREILLTEKTLQEAEREQLLSGNLYLICDQKPQTAKEAYLNNICSEMQAIMVDPENVYQSTIYQAELILRLGDYPTAAEFFYTMTKEPKKYGTYGILLPQRTFQYQAAYAVFKAKKSGGFFKKLKFRSIRRALENEMETNEAYQNF